MEKNKQSTILLKAKNVIDDRTQTIIVKNTMPWERTEKIIIDCLLISVENQLQGSQYLTKVS